MDKNELLENFALFEDWEDRYTYLIDMGRKLPPMDEALKNENTKVQGCTSQVWLVPKHSDENFEFLADSDSHIVKGLIAVLMAVYNGTPRDQVTSLDIKKIFGELGLEDHLSPNRRNGFYAMVGKIQSLAAAGM